MKTAILVPKRGLKIRDPETRVPLSPKGEEKVLSAFWTRRLQDGDVTERIEKPAVASKPAATAAGKPAAASSSRE